MNFYITFNWCWNTSAALQNDDSRHTFYDAFYVHPIEVRSLIKTTKNARWKHNFAADISVSMSTRSNKINNLIHLISFN